MPRILANTLLLTGLLCGSSCLDTHPGEANRPLALPPSLPSTQPPKQPAPIIYFFTRPDCIYCRPMRKLANQLHQQGHTVYVVDPTRQDLIRRYGVSAYPTFLVVDGDTIVRRIIGLTTQQRILGQT